MLPRFVALLLLPARREKMSARIRHDAASLPGNLRR
jgi:hypothetical protein